MSTLEELHEEAMSLADRGDSEKAQQMHTQARASFARAFELERQALSTLLPGDQPTHSVLLRSAASLALEAERYEDALSLLEQGLANPCTPPRLRDELEELFDSLLGEEMSEPPAWRTFEAPVDRVVETGARLPPRQLREVA